MTGVRPLEFWGKIIERDGDLIGPDDEPRRTRGKTRSCADSGHTWPETGVGPCERCGKPSSLPARAELCRHGAPIGFGGHNCEYADLRGMLVAYAAAAADRDVPEGEETIDGTVSWDKAFHRHMDVLAAVARELGRL